MGLKGLVSGFHHLNQKKNFSLLKRTFSLNKETLSFQIRSGHEKDVESCIDIYLNEPLFKNYGATPVGLNKMFRNAIENKDFHFIVACDEHDNVRGFAVFDSKGAFSRSVYLKLIVIDTSARGHNLGARLINHAEDINKDENGMFLLVTSSNYEAQNFYLKLGFVKVGEILSYVKPDIDEYIFFRSHANKVLGKII